MRRRQPSVLLSPLLSLLALASFAACGDGPTEPIRVSISGNAFAFAPPGFPGYGRIVGATVSVLEMPAFRTTTAENGAFRIDGLPAGADVTLILEAEGFPRTSTSTFALPETDLERVTFQVPNEELYGGLAVIANVDLDPTKCQLVSTVTVIGKSLYDPGPHGEAGATVRTEPPLSADHGPIYFNESVLPDPSLTESSGDGGIVFVNVDPGEYTMIAEKEGAKIRPLHMTCQAGTLVNASPPWGLQRLE